MIKPPIVLNTNENIGFDVDGSFLILIRKGSGNQKTVRQFMEKFGAKKESGETPARKSTPPMTLETEDIGIFSIHDTHHILIVKKDSENEKAIREFIERHGNKIARRPSQ